MTSNADVATLFIPAPNPKQAQFLRATARRVAYGASTGPRGTSGCRGKSPWGTAPRRRRRGRRGNAEERRAA